MLHIILKKIVGRQFYKMMILSNLFTFHVNITHWWLLNWSYEMEWFVTRLKPHKSIIHTFLFGLNYLQVPRNTTAYNIIIAMASKLIFQIIELPKLGTLPPPENLTQFLGIMNTMYPSYIQYTIFDAHLNSGNLLWGCASNTHSAII